MNKTKVIFRKFEDGEVIAIFPEDIGNNDYINTCSSYMRVGQHGACNISLIDELERAKSSEYGDIFDELESIGYKLFICEEYTEEMHENRMEAIAEWLI